MIPTVTTPTYTVKLLSVKNPIKYRPYLVREEKILLMAQEGGDEQEIEQAMKDIVRACTFDTVNPDTLPSFDLELLFLRLRAKSVNNIVELRYECKNVPEVPEVGLPLDGDNPPTGPKVCRHVTPVQVNLDEVTVEIPPGHDRKVMITDTLGCVMRYPTNKHLRVFRDSTVADPVALIAECIESIFDASGTVHETKDESPEEVIKFVESLSLQQVGKFRTFFETLPHLTHTIHFTCAKCGYTEDIVLSGLLDFFD